MTSILEWSPPVAAGVALGALWLIESIAPMFTRRAGARRQLHNMLLAACNAAIAAGVFAALTY
ncbi:MAG: hypothetical protein VYC34_10525, partial [Planctomycetota bacterium]|nr:hypothetical protein [Planctomycetota bacterium]